MEILIRRGIQNSIAAKQKILEDQEILSIIKKVAEEIVKAYGNDKKTLFCGNGGSAADAQHLSTELSGKYYLDREPLFAEALHVNTSYLTSVANDYSYELVFARLVAANGRPGDILVALSTSGNSKNIIQAIELANKKGMITVGLTGASGGKMNGICTYLIKVPTDDTPRIQESHIMIGHIICEIVEKTMFGNKSEIA